MDKHRKKPQVVLYISGIAIILFAGVLFILNGLGSGKEEPQMLLTCGEHQLQTLYYGDRYNEMRADLEKGFSRVLNEESWESLPYVHIGDEILIDLKNYDVEKFTVFDYILTKDGKIAYQEAVTLKYQVDVNREGYGVLKLNANEPISKSNTDDNAEEGQVIRGFVLRTEIEGSDFAFGFVVRTDSL